MPTYDYRCDACDHEFELFQQMSDGVKRKCPECGKLKLQRLIGTGAGVIFKGSGFYETDYKRSSTPPSESSGSNASGSDSAGSDASSSGSDDPVAARPGGNHGFVFFRSQRQYANSKLAQILQARHANISQPINSVAVGMPGIAIASSAANGGVVETEPATAIGSIATISK